MDFEDEKNIREGGFFKIILKQHLSMDCWPEILV